MTAPIGACRCGPPGASTQRRDAQRQVAQGRGPAGACAAAVVEAREFEIKHSRATDKSYQSEYDEKHNNAAKAADTRCSPTRPARRHAEEQKVSSTAGKAWEGYRKASQRVLQLGRDKKQQDAADISDGAASMAVDEAMGAVDQLSSFNFKHADLASQHADAVYQRTRNGMLALLAADAAVGLRPGGVVHAPPAGPARRPAGRGGGDGTRRGRRRPDHPAAAARRRHAQPDGQPAVDAAKPGACGDAGARRFRERGHRQLADRRRQPGPVGSHRATGQRAASRPPRRWKSSAPPCATTPTTRARPTSWRRARPPSPSRAAT